MKELPKIYDPKQVESKIYRYWTDGGWFHAERDPDKKPFTIVIPPPNVTGQLHLGHAFDETIQDVLIRWKRMSGYCALWLPGVDHAGIATQGGSHALRSRPRKVPGPCVGLEAALRRPHRGAAQNARLFVRLGAPALHDGRAVRQGRARGVLQPVRKGIYLPRQAYHQLVSALQDRPFRR